jgi:16S rRNA G966 N2-methylase RsmD
MEVSMTLNITYREPGQLVPRKGNPRTHTDKQIDKIARSIRQFGFTNPVLIDRDGGVIAGHGRLAAAARLGLTAVPTICLSDLSETEVRAYVIADNRLAEEAGWDRELLAIEFAYLDALDLDFDLTLTGFDLPEIDFILQEAGAEEGPDPADEVPEPAEGPPTTRPGDVWRIGPHRLICGDATQAATYAALMEGAKAQAVFTDPPYNVPIDGHVCGSGQVKHREFAMAAGEMSPESFTAFLRGVFGHLVAASTDGAIHFHCMDWRHMNEMLAAGEGTYSELKNLCVWAKTNGGMGSLYRSQHELVFVFKSGTGRHINNVELGRNGRYRTNLWSYPGVNSFGGQQADLALHPTVKPTALVADAILDVTRRRDVVLDAFAGSGTTLLAAERTGRRGYGIELDPTYCDVILRRFEAAHGMTAQLEATGQSFDEVAERRAGEEVA